jgi:hypothetical protein
MTPNRRKKKLMRWLNKRGWITGRERFLFGLRGHRYGKLWRHYFNADVVYREDKIWGFPSWLKDYVGMPLPQPPKEEG